MRRIFTTNVSSGYPHYVAKVERKGLTGYDKTRLQDLLDADTTFAAFFAEAELNPNASLITGAVGGVRV